MRARIEELSPLLQALIEAELPADFIVGVFKMALDSKGARDLLYLWHEAPTRTDRDEAIADLHELLDDRDPSPRVLAQRALSEVDNTLEERRRLKEHLRTLVEASGGVSSVARRAEMPQPSLSRLLNTLSEPRTSTLQRLAKAMGLSLSVLTLEAPIPTGGRVHFLSDYNLVNDNTRISYGASRRRVQERQ